MHIILIRIHTVPHNDTNVSSALQINNKEIDEQINIVSPIQKQYRPTQKED